MLRGQPPLFALDHRDFSSDGLNAENGVNVRHRTLFQAIDPAKLIASPHEADISSVDAAGLHPGGERGGHHVQRRRHLRSGFQSIQHFGSGWRLHPGLYWRDAGNKPNELHLLYERCGAKHRRVDLDGWR
jgi:hypothetical protein